MRLQLFTCFWAYGVLDRGGEDTYPCPAQLPPLPRHAHKPAPSSLIVRLVTPRFWHCLLAAALQFPVLLLTASTMVLPSPKSATNTSGPMGTFPAVITEVPQSLPPEAPQSLTTTTLSISQINPQTFNGGILRTGKALL